MADKEVPLKEVLNITDKELSSGTVDSSVITKKLSALQTTNPELAQQVQTQNPALGATSTSIGTVQTVQEKTTLVSGTLVQVQTEVKNAGSCFVPVLMATAIPAQVADKLGVIQNLIIQQIPKVMALITSALLAQTIKIKDEDK